MCPGVYIYSFSDVISTTAQGKLQWSSLQTNFNTHFTEHCDRNNDGPSLIVSGGEHTGGEFYVKVHKDAEPQNCDINGKPFITDGRLLHGHRPYQGDRCSIVAFTHSSFWNSTQSDKDMLKSLGFIIPDERCTLSPPLQSLSDFLSNAGGDSTPPP